MGERLLSLAQASKIVCLSERQLYRVAKENRGPFFKLEGRWRVYEADLHGWVRSHQRRQRATPETVDAMPLPRRRGSSFLAKVVDLDARRAS